MKWADSTLLSYLVAFFASHASCAPQGTYDEDFHVSSGQTCNVEGGIKGTFLTALGDIKTSCDGLAFDPNSFRTTSDYREMRCWFKKECSKDNVPGLCLNKECLSDSQLQNWSKDTTCPQSASGVGCYVEPPVSSSSTDKSLDKQTFSTPENADFSPIIVDSSSSTTTPPITSFQPAELQPILFDDSSSSPSSAAVAPDEETKYLLGQNNLAEQADYSSLSNIIEQAQRLPNNVVNSAPTSFDTWALPKFVG